MEDVGGGVWVYIFNNTHINIFGFLQISGLVLGLHGNNLIYSLWHSTSKINRFNLDHAEIFIY